MGPPRSTVSRAWGMSCTLYTPPLCLLAAAPLSRSFVGFAAQPHPPAGLRILWSAAALRRFALTPGKMEAQNYRVSPGSTTYSSITLIRSEGMRITVS